LDAAYVELLDKLKTRAAELANSAGEIATLK
jgi:hypothetical protein